MAPTVYIQSNSKQYFCAKISAYSLKKLASKPLNVKIINLEDFPKLTQYQGKKYIRKNLEEVWENDTLQSFTPLRFIPPQLQGYQGRALVIDPDVIALTDVCRLLDCDMGGKAILCNFDENEKGRAYKTSVMLLDCDKLSHWRWDETIDQLFQKKISYRQWMSLGYEKDETVGYMAPEWNHMDKLSPKTNLIHYTKKITQPWKTGLPVDFIPDKLPPKWGFIPRGLTVAVKSFFLGGFWKEKAAKFYLENPHADQADVFWRIAAQALKDGVYCLEDVRKEIAAKNIRSDFWEIVQKYA